MPTILELREKQHKILNDIFFMADSEDLEDIAWQEYLSEILESIQGEATKKIDFICSIMLEADGIAIQQREHARRSQVRAQRSEKVVNDLRARILFYMQDFNIKKIEGTHANISISTRKKNILTGNVYDLPDHLLRYKAPEPNMTEINRLIKDGETVPGVQTIEQDYLRVS